MDPCVLHAKLAVWSRECNKAKYNNWSSSFNFRGSLCLLSSIMAFSRTRRIGETRHRSLDQGIDKAIFSSKDAWTILCLQFNCLYNTLDVPRFYSHQQEHSSFGSSLSFDTRWFNLLYTYYQFAEYFSSIGDTALTSHYRNMYIPAPHGLAQDR